MAAQSIVDAIDAAILAMTAGGGAQTISVSGRSVTYMDIASLMKARQTYATLAGQESGDKLPFRLINIKPRGLTNDA